MSSGRLWSSDIDVIAGTLKSNWQCLFRTERRISRSHACTVTVRPHVFFEFAKFARHRWMTWEWCALFGTSGCKGRLAIQCLKTPALHFPRRSLSFQVPVVEVLPLQSSWSRESKKATTATPCSQAISSLNWEQTTTAQLPHPRPQCRG